MEEKKKRKLIVAIDFDGTITKKSRFPDIGPLQHGARDTINYMHDILNIEIIIWTCRTDKNGTSLTDAVNFLKEKDIHFDLVNENSESVKSYRNDDCRKVYSDYIIDDRAFLFEKIDWEKLKEFFIQKKAARKDLL